MVRNWDQVLRTHSFITPRGLSRAFVAICILFATSVFHANKASAKAPYAGIVMDAKTGKILYSHRGNSVSYPASLTKMMTLYLVFEALEQRKITKKTRIRMSKYAASKPPSKLGIKPGRTLSVEQAIYSLVTKSANDVATAVAEHLGGSERNFAARMTNRARQLGMSRTTFRNASGLTAKGQVTTAKDMALLGIALREHYPKYYRYFSTRSFKYGKRKYGNHNRLLGKVKGMDGIKTGYTRLSGFNLVSSVQSNKRSIVAVVMGGKSGKSRNAQMQNIISKYMRKATRRNKRKMLIARIGRAGPAKTQLALTLPKKGPIPVFRRQNNDPVRLRIEQAHTASLAYAANEQNNSTRNVDAIRSKLLAMSNNQAPVPRISPIATQDTIRTASVRPKTPVGLAPMNSRIKSVSAVKSGLAPTKLATQIRPEGWHVQIGAVPAQGNALSLLTKVRNKMPALSNNRKYGALRDYIEPVLKNGTTLYRARFAGFKNKNSARAACNAMKKKRISCLAIKG